MAGASQTLAECVLAATQCLLRPWGASLTFSKAGNSPEATATSKTAQGRGKGPGWAQLPTFIPNERPSPHSQEASCRQS